MILTTQRLLLRPLEMGDAAPLFRILGDPVAMEFWDRPPLPRVTTVEALLADELAAVAAGGFLFWTVLRDNDVIGGIDLSEMAGDGAWLGFLFRRDVWGQGLAHEALDAVIVQAFGALGLSRLDARIQRGNLRAARLLERLAFQRGGALADVVREGLERPCLRYSRTRSMAANGV